MGVDKARPYIRARPYHLKRLLQPLGRMTTYPLRIGIPFGPLQKSIFFSGIIPEKWGRFLPPKSAKSGSPQLLNPGRLVPFAADRDQFSGWLLSTGAFGT